MKKILLSTAAAVAIATGAMSLGTTDAKAGYYGYNYYGYHHCYTKWRTVKVKWKKVWSYYHHHYVWKYRYIKKPYKVCH